MEGIWYYAKENKQMGPLTFAELRSTLSRLPQANNVLVWHAGFDNWRQAQDVPEFRLFTPTNSTHSSQTGPEIFIEPRATESESVAREHESRPTTWRKIGGTLVTIVVFAISFNVARNLTNSGPNIAKPDKAAPISGKAREGFIKGGMETCLRKQESDADNKSLRLSRETLTGYCSCSMNALADSVTFGELENAPHDGTIPAEFQKKIDKVSSPCLEKMQRSLMGASER
jgi:hypothetical protein